MHTIYWDPIKDGYTLDGNYRFDINLSKSSLIKIPYDKHKILSGIFPGLGDYKIRNGWWHAIYVLFSMVQYTIV